MTRPARFLAPLFVAAAAVGGIVACTDLTGPGRGARSSISLAPTFGASAQRAAAVYNASGLVVDQLRIVIPRLPSPVLADTTITVTPGGAEIVVALHVNAPPGET